MLMPAVYRFALVAASAVPAQVGPEVRREAGARQARRSEPLRHPVARP